MSERERERERNEAIAKIQGTKMKERKYYTRNEMLKL